jgi:hypothetical protein
MKLAKILFNVISGNVDSGFGVSDSTFRFYMVLSSTRLDNLRIALQ